MKAHTWEVEYVDAGMLDGHFWKCSTCGASGGPTILEDTRPPWEPFYADGSGLKVSTDCSKAQAQIQEHLKTWVPWDKRPKGPPPGVKVGPVTPRVISAEESAEIHEMGAIGYSLWGHKYGHLDEGRMADFEEHCKAEVAAAKAAREEVQAQAVARNEAWLAAGGRYHRD